MKIKVGTDCSGIEAPLQALKKLNINFEHVFSSEIDPYCIKSIKANYNPKIIFTDMLKRKNSDIPNLDLYVCGFPCQPFSSTGKQKGFYDKRSNIFFKCIEVIKNKKPKIFILENVKGLLYNNNGESWKIVCDELKKIQNIYDITVDIYNTRDYGIPQNRERLYIIGIKKYNMKKIYEKPAKKKLIPLKKFIDLSETPKTYNRPTKSVKHILKRSPSNAIFLDWGQPSNTNPNSHLYAPCLTTNNSLWCVPMKRKSTVKERLMLQGFPTNFKIVVSETQINKQIGNSMSVNVLRYILKECFKCIL